MVGPGLWQIIIILGVTGGIGGSRMIRGIVFSMKENTYLQAARAIGDSTPTILMKHILPNILAPIIIIFSMSVPGTILAEAGLSFLGFGIPPPTPSWGGMLSGDARTYMFRAPWMAFWPGLALSVMVYGVNMFGDALRDLLDPRLRGGVGRYGVKVKKREIAQKERSAGSTELPVAPEAIVFWLKDCVAVDKYTFRCDFNSYNANWEFFLLYGGGSAVPFCSEQVAAGGADWRNAVGTRPFIFTDYWRYLL